MYSFVLSVLMFIGFLYLCHKLLTWVWPEKPCDFYPSSVDWRFGDFATASEDYGGAPRVRKKRKKKSRLRVVVTFEEIPCTGDLSSGCVVHAATHFGSTYNSGTSRIIVGQGVASGSYGRSKS